MYCPHCVFNVLFKYVKYVSIQRKANLSSSGVIGRTFLMDTGTIGFLWGICGDCPILSVTWTAFSFLTPPSESQAPHPQRLEDQFMLVLLPSVCCLSVPRHQG